MNVERPMQTGVGVGSSVVVAIRIALGYYLIRSVASSHAQATSIKVSNIIVGAARCNEQGQMS